MKIIDITGPIREGMWDFGFTGGQFKLRQLNFGYIGEEFFDDGLEVGKEFLHEGFDGLVGSTGTFIETGATAYGYNKIVPTHKIPLQKLVNIDAYVLQMPLKGLDEEDRRKYISLKDIKKAEIKEIPDGAGILVSTGYYKEWFNRKNYLAKSPFFKKEAFDYLLDKKPILVGSDFANWENSLKREGFIPRLYKSEAVILVGCANLDKVNKFKVKLTALPINVENVCMCPARAVVIEE